MKREAVYFVLVFAVLAVLATVWQYHFGIYGGDIHSLRVYIPISILLSLSFTYISFKTYDIIANKRIINTKGRWIISASLFVFIIYPVMSIFLYPIPLTNLLLLANVIDFISSPVENISKITSIAYLMYAFLNSYWVSMLVFSARKFGEFCRITIFSFIYIWLSINIVHPPGVD